MKEATGGRRYSDVGRYLAADGTDTDDAAAAAVGPDGQPVVNPSAMPPSRSRPRHRPLHDVMAFHIGELAIGLGIVLLVLGAGVGVVGVALAGITVPAAVRQRVHLPHFRAHHA